MTLKKREKIDPQMITTSINEVEIKLKARLRQYGEGTFTSRHEILGIIDEEFDELKDAVREKGPLKMENFKQELLDIAVSCVFGVACINSETLDW